ncbi:STM4013/SEN3800 family hydrolase [Streptomyces olivoreticuli]|uniref:STM4013/SEN3800 family hydrolase n=1 Tax=Streptomyces olivoreticuli TaxID=68246 RepID=UPI00265B4F9F|nr:STM4013/SEN3800 family hydrolase [Streptomyces olivoreticuli]WKK22739.1 STM4013/SEN3800 family hydrolase [Streptomyces olivoreticuli]
MINGNEVIPSHHVLLITFDSLRYDVARAVLHGGGSPNLERVLPDGLWEERRTQGSFTLPAHMSFFSGFLPVPSGPARPGRLFACHSIRGTTIHKRTYVFDAPDIVTGLSGLGYRTVCIGGVGFFSSQTKLGRVLPGLFQESYWSPETGTDNPESTRHQVDIALEVLEKQATDKRLFLFLNVSATHTPTHVYLPGENADSWESQCAALSYADRHLGRLFSVLPSLGPWLGLFCADHGEAFGEDGYTGHGIAHPSVWTVPYAETVISARGSAE